MARVTLTQFTNGTIADAPAVNNELAKLATQINGGLDSTNLTAGVLDNTIFSAAYDPVARAKDVVSNFVVSGLTIATSASLSTTVLAGVYYVSGKKVTISNTPITVVASKDTYIDLKDDGSVVQVAVANGATSGMTLTLNSDGTNALRIGKLVSSGSAITTVVQGQNADPIGDIIYPQGAASAKSLINPYKFSACRGAALTTSAADIVFEVEDYDTGNNYDNTTGKFTAPVAGFYVFSSTLTLNYASAGRSIGVNFYKNGVAYFAPNIVTTFNSAFNESYSLTTPAIQLAAGDYITVRNADVGGSSYVTGRANTFFGGYLVSIS